MRSTGRGAARRPPAALDWYKDAVIYEVPVRAFRDGNGDGIGDFAGLTEKLDYLVKLGVTALWLLPFFPSPGRDDGYDIADYTAVHPDYGTLADVRTFLAEAHRRGLRVIGELVLNHTSDQHHWFQRARTAPPGSPWREYYVWSDAPDRYRDARIIFRDFETSNWAWDPVANAYYWHRFYAHQPDLNYESPRVRQEILAVVDFWLDLGLDGLRLDAVPYLYEEDGTSCENLPATHDFLRELRRHVDERYGDRMLLAEANQWPEEAVAYFGAGDGDECHMAFHFPLMPRIFMAVRTEDRFPITDILDQTPPIPPSSQWAIFLRNHDELTLEMVTDEERDYLYRAYARDPAARINLGIRRRLAPLAGTRRKLELLVGMLLSLPGTPVLYYGDEIGMGDNYFLSDRNAVRTPMQWSPDRNAGFSRANRQRLYLPLIVDPEYHHESVNVAVQEENPSSLLWWMRRVIALRRRYPAFARGSRAMVATSNRRILAYVREHGDETILAVANLSRYAQWCELDLAAHAGRRVTELFGETPFPAIGTASYPLSLGPHSFLWFRIEPPDEPADGVPVVSPAADGSLVALLDAGRHRGTALAMALGRRLALDPAYLGADAVTSSIHVAAVVPLPGVADRTLALALVAATTRAGDDVTVPLVLELVTEAATAGAVPPPGGVPVARVRAAGAAPPALLVDVSGDPDAARRLGRLVADPRDSASSIPSLRGRPPAVARRRARGGSPQPARQPIARLVGRVEKPPYPEAVTCDALVAGGAAVEPLAGTVEILVGRTPFVAALAIAEREPDHLTFRDEAAGSLDRFLDTAVTFVPAPEGLPYVAASALRRDRAGELPDVAGIELADVVDKARRVGATVAGVHDVLVRPGGPPLLPFHSMDRRALYQEVRTLLGEVVAALREPARRTASPAEASLAEAVVGSRGALDARLRAVIGRELDGVRAPRYGPPITAGRVVSEAGRFLVGIPGRDARPRVDRERPASPLVDIAGVLVSLRDVALGPIHGGAAGRRGLRRTDVGSAEAWARAWWAHVAGAVVDGYVGALHRIAILPSADADRELLLDILFAEQTLRTLLADLQLGRPPDPGRLVALLDLARTPLPAGDDRSPGSPA